MPTTRPGSKRFVRRVLDPQDSRAFLSDLLAFQAGIALIGAVNGLAQTLLKLTVPGVPDIYRGTELWDLSLVDPDNRRRVDFDLRRDGLERAADPAALLRSWRDGRIKQHVIARTLALRSREPDLFALGDYLPLGVDGSHASRVVAFARQREAAAAIVVAPRLVAPLLEAGEVPLPASPAWADTSLQLPPALTARPLVDVLTGRELVASHSASLGYRRDPSRSARGLAVAGALSDTPAATATGRGPR